MFSFFIDVSSTTLRMQVGMRLRADSLASFLIKDNSIVAFSIGSVNRTQKVV